MDVKVELNGFKETVSGLQRLRANMPKAVRHGIKKEAMRLKMTIKNGIRRGAPGGKPFKPLAESTIRMKGSTKPLINHGDLLRSIRVHTLSDGMSAFVGVHRTEVTKDGGSMVNIAEIHEFGTKPFNIPVTRKMQNYFMAMYIKGVFRAPLPDRAMWIKHPGVPERPYLRPSFDEWKKKFEDNMKKYVLEYIRSGRR